MGYETIVFGFRVGTTNEELLGWVIEKVKYKPVPVGYLNNRTDYEIYDEEEDEYMLDPKYENMTEVEEQYSENIDLADRIELEETIGIKFNTSILDVEDKYYFFKSMYLMIEMITNTPLKEFKDVYIKHIYSIGKNLICISNYFDELTSIEDCDINNLLKLKSELIKTGKISSKTKIELITEH